ncbi:prophage tail fiber N-terminal domain-containing protein [Escherichia coli]|uniref:prophage tail fiber N-terminal domain-containing protein n=3 Tax=Escherichia coli TaxID=562 RepID=UPI0005324078|nr:prophage tail fiber N-terminal domain-containing protein [Escherichia coli]MDM4935763.1 prophage tail fiber N-terminal domain-containing protein [Escherichia coli]MDM4939789.1 prophage tail fiber N-terminal domain-containing protein [Escherichia coli]MDM4956299.1 prophage tail fiber N-terminal domain-containing protein [Escherichia coli]WHG96950.1 prophage tail fiber N-terminal domain-containing protein [Escherichia coli]WHH25861.1 prophage tail fiber N-terminal domain-containing protein [E
MSVLISGVLTDGAGLPMSGYHIILKARQNTSAVVMKTVATVVTGPAGEYAFEAQTGRYGVYLRSCIEREYCVGDISVYDDSKPGTLNDFLTALDEGDLKPDVVKRFEEMVAQAQQSAEAAAKSERQAGQHVADAQQIKSDCETLADNVQQNAEAVAEDKNQVALLALSATQDAARAEQAVKDADKIVQKAVDKLDEAATLTGEAKASAESAAKSEQNAKQHRDEAQRIVDELKGTNASTTQKGLVQLCSDTDNDSEELAATPKAVKTVMDETKTKAPLDSPAFTGTPTTPTPPDDAVGLETANAAFVRKLLAALVDSSPEALDTLNELAAALGNDPNFSTTVINALAGKQPLNDVLTAISELSELTQRADNLLYFNQDGNASLSPLSEKARALLVLDTPETMRTELELKAAATMEAQSDIYDRTAGCLALPGAFGYGHVFSSSEVVYFSAQNGPAEFLKWVFEVTPGRYAVTQYGGTNTSYNPIIAYDMGQPYFRGLVDIDIRYGIDSAGIEAEARRWITFHGDAEYDGGFGEGPAKYQVLVKKSMRPPDLPKAWSRLFWSRNRLMQLLYATENTSKRPPFPGGLVLAAYLPDDGSSEVTLLRAQGVSGSRLRQVVFEAEYRTSGFSAAARSFVYGGTLPGTYVALSGGPDVKFYNRGLVSLFVRIA